LINGRSSDLLVLKRSHVASLQPARIGSPVIGYKFCTGRFPQAGLRSFSGYKRVALRGCRQEYMCRAGVLSHRIIKADVDIAICAHVHGGTELLASACTILKRGQNPSSSVFKRPRETNT